MLQFIILFLLIKITLYSYLVIRKINLSRNNIGILKESLAPLVLMGQSLIIKLQSNFWALRLNMARFHSSRKGKPRACCLFKIIPEISTPLITLLNKKKYKICCFKLEILYMTIFEKRKLRDLGIVVKPISKFFKN